MTTIDDIKSRLDIVTYISRHVELKKAGRHFKASCPFHDEKTPSFVVNPVRQTWRCYGACATSGDIFDFYQQHHHVDFKTALTALAQDAGVELPDYGKKQDPTQQRQTTLLAELATSFNKMLMNFDGAEFVRDYLHNRHLTDDTIQHWQLGYAPAQNIIPKLLDKGHRADDLLALGIAYQTDIGQLRSRFYNRLMIPIHNPAGQVVGFGARQLDGQGAKYVNSRESDLFTKSNLLYGWHIARQVAQWSSTLVIVEGYMDVLQAHQQGYTNVVAQMGTALTDNQLRLIQNIDTLMLCLDGDDAGQQATDRAIDAVISHAETTDIRIVSLSGGQDPDTIIRAGEWQSALDNAVPVIDYLITRAVSQLPENASLGQRHAVANDLIPKLYKLDDNTSKLWSIQQLASALNMNALALVDTAQQLMNAKSRPAITIMQEPSTYSIINHPIEAYIIRCLIEHSGWYWDIAEVFGRLGIEMLNRRDFEAYGDIFQQIEDALDGEDLPQVDIDISQLSDTEPGRDALLLNVVQLRLKHIQHIMDELVELQDIDRFSDYLAMRTHLQFADI